MKGKAVLGQATKGETLQEVERIDRGMANFFHNRKTKTLGDRSQAPDFYVKRNVFFCLVLIG